MATICVFVCVYDLVHKVGEGHNLQVSKYGLIKHHRQAGKLRQTILVPPTLRIQFAQA